MSLATGDQMLAILMFSISYEYAIGDERKDRMGVLQRTFSIGSFVLGFIFVRRLAT
jgi:hypothetical protein